MTPVSNLQDINRWHQQMAPTDDTNRWHQL